MMTATSQKHVLIVDDNPGDIALCRQVLEGVPDITVKTAHNVMQAHAFLGRLPPFTGVPAPDLILLDLRMPMLPGTNVIPLVRRDPAMSQVRIVVFTSSSLDSDRAQCDALGADDYVVKPSDWVQWKTTITDTLRRHGLLGQDKGPGVMGR
jgi:two-component system response regulator